MISIELFGLPEEEIKIVEGDCFIEMIISK